VLIAKQIKEDVAAEVSALAAKGIVPGLAVSWWALIRRRSYVRARRGLVTLGIYSEKIRTARGNRRPKN